MEKRMLEIERRMASAEVSMAELTKSISNGLSKDIASIKESLIVLCDADQFHKDHITKLEEASWFLTWINQTRDSLFKTFVKALGLLFLVMAGICFLGEKGMMAVKSLRAYFG